jgi:hypothetical protein
MLRLIDGQLDEEAADSNCKTQIAVCSRGFCFSSACNQPGLDSTLLCAVTDKSFRPPINPAQICLRPANHKDVPFLLELRRQTMHPHLLASGLIPSLEEDMRRVLLRLDCAQIILLANQPVGLLKVARDGMDWDLIQIQLARSLHGQGFGAQLIQHRNSRRHRSLNNRSTDNYTNRDVRTSPCSHPVPDFPLSPLTG